MMKKSIKSWAWLVTAVAFASTNVGVFAKQKAALVDDPVFGTTFDPSVVKFDPLPQDIKARCSVPLDADYRIFGRVDRATGSDMIVLAFPKRQDGDAFGAVLSIRGSSCKTQDANWVLSGRIAAKGYGGAPKIDAVPGLTEKKTCDSLGNCQFEFSSQAEETLVRALMTDAWGRAQKAWGSPANFKAKACAKEILDKAKDYPVILSFLRTQCKK